MIRQTILSAAALILITGPALAQTTTTQSTTVTAPSALPVPAVPPAPPLVVPAPGTTSSTESQRTVDSNGNEYDSTKTTYGTANGSASESTTSDSVQPASVPGMVTTTMKKTTTVSTGN